VLLCVVVVCGAWVMVGAAVVGVGAVVVVVDVDVVVLEVELVVVVSSAPAGPAPIAKIEIMSTNIAPLKPATEARRGEDGRITGATLDRRHRETRAINAGAEDRSRSCAHQ